MIEEITVQSWNELNERLYEGSWNRELARFRSNLAFRGTPSASHTLITSLRRLGGDYARQEENLLRNFRKYAYETPVHGDSIWNWLALAQHHGLPTRLLDWTYSPYVALHFVTENLEFVCEDGAVWAVDFTRTNEFLPGKLKSLLEKYDSNVFTVEMLSEAAPTLDDFGGLSRHDFVAFFEPPSLDERIVNQYALFSLMSSPSIALEEWLRDKTGTARRIIIPGELKWEIRDKLDQANITERVLFPGLDGLSRWLTRYYSPRPRS